MEWCSLAARIHQGLGPGASGALFPVANGKESWVVTRESGDFFVALALAPRCKADMRKHDPYVN